MPKYIVQHTPVRHGAEKAKQSTRYEVGEVIELDEKDAQKLGDNMALIKEEVKEPAGKGAAEKEPVPDTGGDPEDKGNSPEGETVKGKKKQQ